MIAFNSSSVVCCFLLYLLHILPVVILEVYTGFDIQIQQTIRACQPVIESMKANIPVYHSYPFNEKANVWEIWTCDKECQEISSLTFLLVIEQLAFFIWTGSRWMAMCIVWARRAWSAVWLVWCKSWKPAEVFWQEFLEEGIGTAMDECRHSEVVHVAKAISVRDFKQQVEEGVHSILQFLVMN